MCNALCKFSLQFPQPFVFGAVCGRESKDAFVVLLCHDCAAYLIGPKRYKTPIRGFRTDADTLVLILSCLYYKLNGLPSFCRRRIQRQQKK